MRTTLSTALTLWVAPALLAAGQFPTFVDVASPSGITIPNVSGGLEKDYVIESVGNGAGFFDYDNDGDADLVVTNGSTLAAYPEGGHPMARLYRNDPTGFADVSRQAGIDRHGWAMGVCVADYDNDGDRDFYVTAFGPNVLYRNNGDGTFSDVSSQAGTDDRGWGTNCAFGDYDRDGHLDLYVANYVVFDASSVPRRGEDPSCEYLEIETFCGPFGLERQPDVLFHNNGNGTFTDATLEAAIRTPRYGFGVVFSDLDNDGWLDIYVANDADPNLLFHNLKNGVFEEIGLRSGTALDERGRPESGMGLDAGDFDRDGDMDLFVTNYARESNTLYENQGEMIFRDVTAPARLAEVSPQHLGWGTAFADLDNDGWLDIVVANGHVYPQIGQLDVGQTYAQPKELYRNRGDGTFEEVGMGPGGASLNQPRPTRGLALADMDNDGDTDFIAININDVPSLYRNDLGNGNHWLTLRLEGTESNRDAIGARVEVEAGGVTQVSEVRSGGSFLSHNDMRVHFGLGPAGAVDRLRIRWPMGNVEEWTGLEADQFVTIREGDGTPIQ